MDSKIKIMDYAVLGLYFVGMLAIGYFCNKKYANNVDGFFAGGKNLGPWVFALTYGSTYLSSSTFVGNTATAYSGGLAFSCPLRRCSYSPSDLSSSPTSCVR